MKKFTNSPFFAVGIFLTIEIFLFILDPTVIQYADCAKCEPTLNVCASCLSTDFGYRLFILGTGLNAIVSVLIYLIMSKRSEKKIVINI